MKKRDPEKTARNERCAFLAERRAELLPEILRITGFGNVHSLNAKIGGKFQEFLNVKERSIPSAAQMKSLYFDELRRRALATPVDKRADDTVCEIIRHYQESDLFREYIQNFLEGAFLKHFEEYARAKPTNEEAQIWIGQNNAEYGLFVTPRFNKRTGEWENDKSEIREFKPQYFTIGHVLESGLAIPGRPRVHVFQTPDQYLEFFLDVVVRHSGSKHQTELAERYCAYASQQKHPENVPLLIPELRYGGLEKRHKYRLDFCVIDPATLRKVGFELSPWSSHGWLTGTRLKKVAEVNAEARANFEAEAEKLRRFFLDRGITVLIFTDEQLSAPEGIFSVVARFLVPEQIGPQLLINSQNQLMNLDLYAEVDGVDV